MLAEVMNEKIAEIKTVFPSAIIIDTGRKKDRFTSEIDIAVRLYATTLRSLLSRKGQQKGQKPCPHGFYIHFTCIICIHVYNKACSVFLKKKYSNRKLLEIWR